ncbi:hypothetical protein V6Z11_A05G430500 [Gossypium hirsutum]
MNKSEKATSSNLYIKIMKFEPQGLIDIFHKLIGYETTKLKAIADPFYFKPTHSFPLYFLTISPLHH